MGWKAGPATKASWANIWVIHPGCVGKHVAVGFVGYYLFSEIPILGCMMLHDNHDIDISLSAPMNHGPNHVQN